MPALAFDAFSNLLNNKVAFFDVDLSQSTMTEVLDAYKTHKNKVSPKFKVSHITEKLKEIEQNVGATIMPINITDVFYNVMIEYLLAKGLSPNTIENYLTTIRAALRWSTKHNCKLSSTYEDFTVKTVEPHREVLTPDMLSHIAHFDVNTINTRKDHKKTLEKVRDQFVMQTIVYQRYSDAKRISPENFDCDKYSVVQQKTGNKATVDIGQYSMLPDYAKRLFKKYNYHAAYSCTINRFNEHLHCLLHHIGEEFDEIVTIEKKINGKIERVQKKRADLISSHCARRSAITNGVKNARTETEIRKCSGHKGGGRDAFQKYINFDMI